MRPGCLHFHFSRLSHLFAFYRVNEMDTQEACPGFMVLEEDIAEEEDENIVID